MLNERPYFSIGEVLGLLLEEFPDVTISKIRFLENQGLIDPERTPSGYRKFYDRDLNRLRFILREQKDNYLPLKVIKERLEGTDGTPAAPPRPVGGASWALIGNAEPPEAPGSDPFGHESEVELTADATSAFVRIVADGSEAHTQPPVSRIEHVHVAAPEDVVADPGPPEIADPTETAPEPVVSTGPVVLPRQSTLTTDGARGAPSPAPVAVSEPTAAPVVAVPESVPAPVPAVAPVIEAGELTVELGTGDLCARAGISPQLLGQLREYGLIEPTMIGGEPIFGLDALRTATAAGKLAGHGLEARHLRTWKVSAEREATLFEQMIQPLMRQRNPASRRQAAELAAELSRAGGELRAALMRNALRTYLDD